MVTCDEGTTADHRPGEPGQPRSWAGTVAMKASAQNQCSTAFNRYRPTLDDPESFIPGYFLPNETQWDKGNRTITCTLTMDAPFTGPKL